jgi:hypothetical protein
VLRAAGYPVPGAGGGDDFGRRRHSDSGDAIDGSELHPPIARMPAAGLLARLAKMIMTPDPRFRVDFRPGYRPTEPLTDDEGPDD